MGGICYFQSPPCKAVNHMHLEHDLKALALADYFMESFKRCATHYKVAIPRG